MTTGELEPATALGPVLDDLDDLDAQNDLDDLDAQDERETQWGALQALARAMHTTEPGLTATLNAILAAAVDLIDGVDFGGINLLRGECFEPQAVLGEAPNVLDALQQRTGRGPCIDASREQQVIRVDEVSSDPRWPEYSELAASVGVRAMLCLPLWVDANKLGSISLYSRSTRAFGRHAERMATLLAVHAAIALADAQRVENLASALRNRDVIGQAKGILMERHRITADAAFAILATASQRCNRKLSVVAEQVATTGVVPT